MRSLLLPIYNCQIQISGNKYRMTYPKFGISQIVLGLEMESTSRCSALTTVALIGTTTKGYVHRLPCKLLFHWYRYRGLW